LDFVDFRDMVNPFAQGRVLEDGSRTGAFSGDADVDMDALVWTAGIVYYIEDVELFSAGIYLVPLGVHIYHVDTVWLEGAAAVVVLDERGWFGGFAARNLVLPKFIDAEHAPPLREDSRFEGLLSLGRFVNGVWQTTPLLYNLPRISLAQVIVDSGSFDLEMGLGCCDYKMVSGRLYHARLGMGVIEKF
jgi:hypothetical protein